jgi:copper oxidase (laccase) domain-containing protein
MKELKNKEFIGLKSEIISDELLFLNNSVSFKDNHLQNYLHKFLDAFRSSKLILLNQTHSNIVCKININEIKSSDKIIKFEGDGMCIPKNLKGFSFGIRTADCVPIFIETQNYYFLIHAGWKGLQSGILEQAAKVIPNKETPFNLVIGPCAGNTKYEVGRVVSDSFNSENVVFCPHQDSNKVYLDLKLTAVKLFEYAFKVKSSQYRVEISDICTISNLSWHSHRRDAESRGANLMVIVT